MEEIEKYINETPLEGSNRPCKGDSKTQCINSAVLGPRTYNSSPRGRYVKSSIEANWLSGNLRQGNRMQVLGPDYLAVLDKK